MLPSPAQAPVQGPMISPGRHLLRLTRSRALRLGVALAALLLLAPAPSAQKSVKQAQKLLKKQLVEGSKNFQTAVNDAFQLVSKEIKAARKMALQGAGSVNEAQKLFDELVNFQKAVDDAYITNRSSFFISVPLQALDDEADIDTVYPNGFVNGDGGLIDQFMLKNEGIVAKPYKRLRKLLASYAKAATKGSDLFITYVVRAPQTPQYFVWRDSFGSMSFISRPRLDLVMGVSPVGVDDSQRRFFVRGKLLGSATIWAIGAVGTPVNVMASGSDLNNGVSLGGTGSSELGPGNYAVKLIVDGSSPGTGDEFLIGLL